MCTRVHNCRSAPDPLRRKIFIAQADALGALEELKVNCWSALIDLGGDVTLAMEALLAVLPGLSPTQA